MDSGATRRHIWLYLLTVGALSGLTIGLLYAVFTAGFADGVEAFLADPPGTVREHPLGLLAVASVFLALLALFAAVVVGGTRYANLGSGDTPPK